MTLPTPETKVVCHILDTGHCLARESMMIRGGRSVEVECHALVALIEHPQHGWGLWDTGYAPRMEQATERWPFRMFRYATPLRLRPELAAAAQLPRWGLAPADIGWVVLSHLHADHLAGLRDFPNARIYLTAAAHADFASRKSWRALAHGYIPSLLPADLTGRATLIGQFADPPLPILGPTHDLFGDGALRLVQLPGHARGQVGMLAHTAERRILFAADGAWMTRSIRERRLPHPLTYLIVDDRRQLRQTLDRLHDFARRYSDITLIPTHCPEVYAREVAG